MPNMNKFPVRYHPSPANSTSGNSGPPDPHPVESAQMIPCRFYASGYCHRGNRCRFHHPAASSMINVIPVPPLPPSFGLGTLGTPIGGFSTHPIRQHNGSRPQVQHHISQTYVGDGHEHHEHDAPTSWGSGESNANSLLHAVLEQTQSSLSVSDDTSSTSETEVVSSDESTPNSISQELINSTTLFEHIDWQSFLAPGQQPPPVYTFSDVEKVGTTIGSGDTLIEAERNDDAGFCDGEANRNQDVPPEGMLCNRDESRKLSAKEELQMKVKEIAKALAAEPQPVDRPLDSFFKQFPGFDVNILPESMIIRTGFRPPQPRAQAPISTAIQVEEIVKDEAANSTTIGIQELSLRESDDLD